MTRLELVQRTLKRLDQDPAAPIGYWTAQEIVDALDQGQRLFALLTLCLETTATLPTSPPAAFYLPRSTFSDYLVTLYATTGGKRIEPCSLLDLDAIDSQWQTATAKAPSHYAAIGGNLIALRGSAGVVSLTYARAPQPLANDNSVPEIPQAAHPALIEYAIPRVRLKQGGQEFSKAMPYYQKFLGAAAAIGEATRARAIAERYDRLPFELSKKDLASWSTSPK